MAFQLRIPAATVIGQTYFFNIASSSYNYNNPGESRTCIPITVSCTPPAPRGDVNKRVEGVASNGNFMVYWLEYDFFNSTNNQVQDTVPACATIVAASVQPYNGAAAGGSGQTRTWRVQDAGAANGFRARGSLWVQVSLAGCSGTICNTATFNSAEFGSTNSNQVCQTVGGPNVILNKSQYNQGFTPLANGGHVADGDHRQLRAAIHAFGVGAALLRPFDGYTAGNYTTGGGVFGGNWTPSLGSNAHDHWDIVNASGDKYVRFTPGANPSYSALLFNCPGAYTNPGGSTPDICGGQEVVVDLKHNQPSDVNADAGLWLRYDSRDPAQGYLILLSGDTNPDGATPGAGHLIIQRNNGTAGAGCCSYPADSGNAAAAPALDGVWYTIRAVEPTPGRILAKFWPRGSAEPAGWMIDWTDPAPLACGTNADAYTWRPGLAGQNAETHYDNMHVYSSISLDTARLWDTVPAGIDYVSAGPAPNGMTPNNSNNPNTGDMIRWDFTGGMYGAIGNLLYGGSGSFTWTGITDCTESVAVINNTGRLGALPPAGQQNSNTTTLNLTCGTPTYTPSQTSTRTPTATRTATRTATPTATITVTPTHTATRTATRTATPSATITATSTYSATRTHSPSPTPTFTATLTRTPTATRTATPTVTDTNTPGSTPTYTATRTASPTATPSSTVTFTPTATATRTNSPSPTPTFTITVTRTSTATPTETWTSSPTQSPGPSATFTATRTHSPTATSTYTITVTRTSTATPTETWTDSPTQSPGPSPTYTATRTHSPSVTPTFTVTVTRTSTATSSATPTATPSFTLTLTYTDTPANTATNTPTVTPTATPSSTYTVTPTWTPTATRSITWTNTATRTATPTFTATPTASPTITITWTFSVSPTITPTPIPVPHQVKLAAYNAAGELVKIIYEGAAQYIPADLKLSVDTFLGGSGAVVITFPGAFASGGNTVSWGGYNDSAMLVQGGVYTIKAEITDPFGQVTALIKPVQVVPGGVQQTLRIYNSAGEMVRSIILPAPVAGAARLQTLGDAFGLEIDPATGSAVQPFKIDVLGNAGWTTASWDGLNDAGAPVSSGSYTLQLVSNEGGKSSVVTSRSVTVLKAAAGSEVLDSALLGPNPVLAGQPALLFYDPAGLAGRRAEALVYNLAGELIGWGGDPNLSGRIDLGLGKAQAGGVYLVRFQLRSGSVVTQSRVLKLAIVH